MVDPYAVLGVPPDATEQQIASAHRRAVLRTHPDRGGDAEDFRVVQQAFELLSDPAERLSYDRRRAAAEARMRPGPGGWGPGQAPPWSTRPPGPWVYERYSGRPGAGDADVWVRSYRVTARRPTPPPARPAPVRNPWTAIGLSLVLLVVLSAGTGLSAAGFMLFALPLLALAGSRRRPGGSRSHRRRR